MSMDGHMAWRNVWRNPRRSLLTMSAIAFACLLLVFMLSFQFGSYEALINASVRIHTGHVQVQACDYHREGRMHQVVPAPDAVLARLERIPDLAAATVRARAFSLAASAHRTYGVLVNGIDPQREASVSTLPDLIRQGRFLAPGDDDRAVLGELLASNLQVGLGDEVTLLGQGRDGSVAATVVTVAGIYRTGMDDLDRNLIHIPLDHFRQTYAMAGAAHSVVAVARSLDGVGRITAAAADLEADGRLCVLDWQELVPGLRQAIEMDLISALIFYLVLILVVAFSIMNTFLMTILERAREFGVLLALGTTPGRLMRLVLMESATLTALGAAAGILLGTLVTLYFQRHGLMIAGSAELLQQYGISGRMYPRLSLLSLSIGPLAVLLITCMAALFPALRIRVMRPVEALRHV